jgi:hypothetical protein
MGRRGLRPGRWLALGGLLVLAAGCSRRPVVPEGAFLGTFEGQSEDGRPVTASLWRQADALGGVLQSGDQAHTLALRTALVAEGVTSGPGGTALAEVRLSGDGRSLTVRARGAVMDLQRREAATAAPVLDSYATASGDLDLRLWRQGALLTGNGAWLGQSAALLGHDQGGGRFAIHVVAEDGVRTEGTLQLSERGAQLELLGRTFELERRGPLALGTGGGR